MSKRTHGKYSTKVYHAWEAMLQRCNNPRHPCYKHYGGRGISVCERWISFISFLEDMGEPEDVKLSLDRIDNNGNYCPENCRWVNQKKQIHNSRRTKLLTYNGITDSLRGWSKRLGVSSSVVAERLKHGKSLEEAVTLEKGTVTKCRKVTHNGKTFTVKQWADFLNININTLKSRFKKDWPISKILEPKKHKKGKLL